MALETSIEIIRYYTDMKQATQDILNNINRTFYQKRAEEFSQTRQSFWKGWNMVWKIVSPTLPQNPMIMDVGCGNGRFGQFLISKLGANFQYIGVDSADALLGKARVNLELLGNRKLINADVFEIHYSADLVVLFGVLHHIPGLAQRNELVKSLHDHVNPGGKLALSLWHADRIASLYQRQAKSEDLKKLGIDPEDLEAGDVLLPFGIKKNSWRYVHIFSDREINGLIKTLEIKTTSKFEADGRTGRLNTYLILEKEK